MRPPRATLISSQPSGSWQVIARPYAGDPLNVTTVRGIPTKVGELTTTDPFGPAAATLTFPRVTILDAIGEGDLYWLAPETDVDIRWVRPDGVVDATWEGYFMSYEFASDDVGGELTVTCNGAMKQLDNYLAKPEFLYRPLPYEWAIARCFTNRSDLRVTTMPAPSSSFPSWWTTKFVKTPTMTSQPWTYPLYLEPGNLWSGMLTRQTGNWEPTLTGYVQGLLANMWTERGQFSVMLDPGRIPVLRHRDHLMAPDDTTLVVDLMWPGVKMSASKDFSQRIGVAYASGKAPSGDSYTGMQVAADGSFTWYEPAAWRRQVHPANRDNPWWQQGVMRKEVMIAFSDDLTAEEARRAAEKQVHRFADPGTTGTLTLLTDPLDANGAPVARQRVFAGRSVLVRGLFGRREGVLFHITEATVSGTDPSVSWTLDTQFRDQLTVDQVRRRGRDSLVPIRMLSTSSTYAPKLPDLLFPWNYKAGSGVIPAGAAPLFNTYGPAWAASNDFPGDPQSVPFPWTEFTLRYPPSAHPEYYIHIPPASKSNANVNWANKDWRRTFGTAADPGSFHAFPVRLAAQGEIKLVQLAAYDRNGNVKPVPFHASLYKAKGISYTSMPMIPPDASRNVTTAATVSTTYGSDRVLVTGMPRGHGVQVAETILVTCPLVPEVTSLHFEVTESSATAIAFHLGMNAKATKKGKATIKEEYSKTAPYPSGQHYPFFPAAWEHTRLDGGTPTNLAQISTDQSLLVGWGTYYEKAGFWPGSSLNPDDAATGLLSDSSGFSFSFFGDAAGVSMTDTPEVNQKYPDRVTAYLMIYCDADATADTYFMGRMFRKELS